VKIVLIATQGNVLTFGLAYRLYTVIPRLLLLIDELTNWYIRFNRARLKGEGGPEDTVEALNTLFETLFTLCKTMVCQNHMLIYLTLIIGIPSSPRSPPSSQKVYTRL
jgi:isoleucyl-tRNA synthetase